MLFGNIHHSRTTTSPVTGCLLALRSMVYPGPTLMVSRRGILQLSLAACNGLGDEDANIVPCLFNECEQEICEFDEIEPFTADP